MNAAVTFEERTALLDGIAHSASILEACTLHPWVVSVGYHFEPGVHHVILQVVERRMDDRPDPLGFLPEGAELSRAEVFPAARFESMPAATRSRWMPHYRAYLLWASAKALGKQPHELQPWIDVDPVFVSETVERWANPGVRYTGD